MGETAEKRKFKIKGKEVSRGEFIKSKRQEKKVLKKIKLFFFELSRINWNKLENDALRPKYAHFDQSMAYQSQRRNSLT